MLDRIKEKGSTKGWYNHKGSRPTSIEAGVGGSGAKAYSSPAARISFWFPIAHGEILVRAFSAIEIEQAGDDYYGVVHGWGQRCG